MVKSECAPGGGEEELSRKKKKRNIGEFPCLKCNKVFSRSDHLARHYLNHQPKQVYVCEYPVSNHDGSTRKCGKTFVRKDLRERHFRRHSLERADGRLDSEPPETTEEYGESPLDVSNLIETKNESMVEQVSEPGVQKNGNSNLTLEMPVNVNPPIVDAPKVVEVLREQGPNISLNHIPNGEENRVQSLHANVQPGPPLPHHNPHLMPHNGPTNGPTNGPHGPHKGPHNFQLNAPHGNPGVPQQTPLSRQNSMHLPAPQIPLPQQPFMGTQQHHHHQPHLFIHSSNAASPDQHYFPPNPQYGSGLPAQIPPNIGQMRHPNLASMGPPHVRQEPDLGRGGIDMFANGPNVVQSQNDILSWLFMESPNDMNSIPPASTPTSTYSGVSESLHPGFPSQLHLQYQQQHNPQTPDQILPRPVGIDQNSQWSMQNNQAGNYAADSMLNVGLQDLNYFLRNENPLDEVFLKLQTGQTGNSSNDKLFRNFNTMSSNSTTSPTNTNESATPQAFSEIHVNGVDRGTVKSRLEYHLANVNIEKNKHFYMNQIIWARIMSALSEISTRNLEEIFTEEGDMLMLEHRMSFYLYGYWETFHRRFSILHKPSFNTATAEPLLLLAMLIVGCMYCATTTLESGKRMACAEFKFCMLVAEPLRFKLFQHPNFKCPVPVWMLQSLNLLEWCEKNFLSRGMHERAHIHHGTTVQLLRRSPFLGGNPTVKNKPNNLSNETSTSGSEDDNLDGVGKIPDEHLNDQSLFREWVESESMKRVTFLTFYLDTIDHIKFRHNPQIPFFQLQLLNLPCDEENLWESNEINGSFKKLVKRQKKLQGTAVLGVRNMKDQNRIKPDMNFLSALKRLMKPQTTKYNYSFFTRSILFGGVISIIHQMQQMDLQNKFTILSSVSDKNRNIQWKEFLVRALDAYETDLYSTKTQLSLDPFFSIEEFQCKFPMYHLALIIGISDINHYDIAIFSGSPRNMSVDVSPKDISIVKRKLGTIWNPSGSITSFNDLVNTRSVIHCFWLLWTLMLSPLNDEGAVTESRSFYTWDADHDCYDVMYATSVATLVLWCYTYTTCGLESPEHKDLADNFSPDDQKCYEKLSPLIKEDAYNYLFRIRDEFSKNFQKEGLLSDYCIHKTGTNRRRVPLFDAIEKHCELLPKITGKENISGLCFLIGTKLYKSQWEIIRENAKLILNCGLRSIGKSTWKCPDVFENDFLE